jgi:Flp pilus assembly protein TadG
MRRKISWPSRTVERVRPPLRFRGPAHRARGWRALAGGGRGTAAVEFALAAPVLAGLLVPVADLGIAYSRQIQVQQAAQAGAQYATFHPWNSSSTTAIADAVTAASTLPGISASPAPREFCGCPTGTAVSSVACGTTCPDGQTAGYYVVVSATMSYTPQLPYSVLGDPVTLKAQSTTRVR